MSNHTLRITPGTAGPDAYGLIALHLSLLDGDGKEVGHLPCYSGQPGRQVFRTHDDPKAVAGCMEPLPEAVYRIQALDWAGGRHNYTARFSGALGPVFALLLPVAGYEMARSEFGFHLDANLSTAPGSAGCPTFRTLADLKTWVGWMEAHKPATVTVDYGLGTVPKPGQAPPPALSVTFEGKPIPCNPKREAGVTRADLRRVVEALGFDLDTSKPGAIVIESR